MKDEQDLPKNILTFYRPRDLLPALGLPVLGVNLDRFHRKVTYVVMTRTHEDEEEVFNLWSTPYGGRCLPPFLWTFLPGDGFEDWEGFAHKIHQHAEKWEGKGIELYSIEVAFHGKTQ